MTGKCSECGLQYRQAGTAYCFKTKQALTEADLGAQRDCYHFMAIMYEDGEALTPEQHFALAQREIARKHMQGVI